MGMRSLEHFEAGRVELTRGAHWLPILQSRPPATAPAQPDPAHFLTPSPSLLPTLNVMNASTAFVVAADHFPTTDRCRRAIGIRCLIRYSMSAISKST